MRIMDIAFKNCLQILRDRKSVIFLVFMPIAFTLFFGFVMSGAISDPRLPVGWMNADGDNVITADLSEKLEAADVVRLVSMEPGDEVKASNQVRDEKLAAAVMIPADFSESVLSGEISPITLITLPGSAAGSTARTAVESAVNQLLSSIVISKLSAGAFEALHPFADQLYRSSYLQQGMEMASQAWTEPPFSIENASERDVLTSSEVKNKGFLQSSPGMIVMFAVMNLTTCSMVLYIEKKGKTLERLLTTTVSRAQIIAGQVLSVFFVFFLQEIMLIAMGQIFFGVDYLREPLGTLLMMVSLGLWTACLGLLIGVISKTHGQVILLGVGSMMFFSAIGGAWWPLEITTEVFQFVGHLTPAAWAMDGFQNIVMRGQDFTSTLLPAGMVALFSFVFFIIAVWRFNYASSTTR